MTVPERIPERIDCQLATDADVGQADLRDKARFALLIRSAKLTCEFGEFLCIVRDVSEGGVKLKLFHPIPTDCPFSLELSSGDCFEVEQVWSKDGQAGFRFCNEIDIPRFISEASPFPKRSPRLKVQVPAIIRADGAISAAQLCDLSRDGIGIVTDLPLALEQKVTVQAQNFGARAASVRWRKIPSYGLAMQDLLSFETLARIAARLQLPTELLGDLGTDDTIGRPA